MLLQIPTYIHLCEICYLCEICCEICYFVELSPRRELLSQGASCILPNYFQKISHLPAVNEGAASLCLVNLLIFISVMDLKYTFF